MDQDSQQSNLNGPEFSVVIAVYNGAATIAKAIQSILDQSYPAKEIIVVDDGSTDRTAEIVRGFGDPVRYHFQPNAGVSTARNKGVELACGDWLAFLDADDWYYPDRLLLHAELIKRDSDLDFLTADFDYVNEMGEPLGRSLEKTEAGQVMLDRAEGAEDVVMSGDVIGLFVAKHFGDTHTLSVPRQMFLDQGGYPHQFAVCEDVNFLIRLCAASERIGVITRPVAAYRIHANSATRHDPLRAQRQTLDALLSLKKSMSDASATIQSGLKGALRYARMDLAYCLLRQGAYFGAIAAVSPMLLTHPGTGSIRDLLSIIKGLPE